MPNRITVKQDKETHGAAIFIKILLRIITDPYKYNQSSLARVMGISRDTVYRAKQAFKRANLHWDQHKSSPYKIAILGEKTVDALERLQVLNEKDKSKISEALKNNNTGPDHVYILNKLESLYDFQKLGIRSLRKPELVKIDELEKSINLKKQVTLVNYHSNSNDIRDRTVECFHTNLKAGMIQVFDPGKNDTRHFKLNRFERVVIEKEDWQYEPNHNKKTADVFRIADNDLVNIHLKLNVYAYNSLVETFPETRAYILPSNEKNSFDFQVDVNHNFLGVVPFILANAKNVEILYPLELKKEVTQRAREIIETYV